MPGWARRDTWTAKDLRMGRSACLKGGVIKGGVYKRKRTQTNAPKRRQTKKFRLSEMGPNMQTNAHKREQTQTNANKRKIEEFHPFFAPSASGGSTEGGAILLHVCGSSDPCFMQQNEPFLFQNLCPCEGNPLKHRLILRTPFVGSPRARELGSDVESGGYEDWGGGGAVGWAAIVQGRVA